MTPARWPGASARSRRAPRSSSASCATAGKSTLTLTLGELPKERQARANVEEKDNQATDVPRLGLSLAPAKGGGEGVVVTSVDPNGTAGDRFKTGDVILDVNGKLVSSPAEVRKAVSDAHAGGKRTVLMRVKSGQGDALRRRSARQRMTNRRAPLACRPHGGGSLGDGLRPVPGMKTRNQKSPASIAPAGVCWSEGRWVSPAALPYFEDTG